MTEIVQSCPLCGDLHSRFFESRPFRGQIIVNRICKKCGLVFQSPRMTDGELDAFYASGYRLLQEGSSTPTARNVDIQQKRAGSLLDFVRSDIPSLSRHLDIGCSIGILLKQFQAAYHNTGVGVEPGEAHRLHARNEGLTVYATLDELENAAEARFDLISMSHVLEHLSDPAGYLTHLRESILVPEGWLLLEVPNLYAHDSFETAHLVAYSAHTLQQALEKAGFEIVRMEKHGRPRSPRLQLYITLLARPKISTQKTFHLIPERGVFIKRRVGMFYRRVLERLFSQSTWIAFED